MDMLTNVVDKNGRSYNVEKKLGEGSQGETFILQGGNYIAKLYKSFTNPTELKSKINFLIHLNLDKEFYSVPIQELVSPKSGYISELATGMIPLSELRYGSHVRNFGEWFVNTGGLLKRYGVLIKLANVLRTLHSKALIYCDLSPNNVFISCDSKKHNVFMIDMDNLKYKSSIVHNIYTPFYGAPEVVKSLAPNTIMSDCYSFAVIAYELLACNHPLFGDMVNDGEPEMEERALRGELPWVEDEKDDSNSRSTGIPSSYFISKPVMKLFRKTFEDGLNNPFERPSIGDWVDALNDALNDLLRCKDCNIHYPYSNSGHCPFCGKEPSTALPVKIQRWEEVDYYDKTSNQVKKHFILQPLPLGQEIIMVDSNTQKYIKAYHLLSTNGGYDTPIARLKIEPADNNEIKLLFEPIGGKTVYFRIQELDKEYRFNETKTIRFNLVSHKTMIIGMKDFTNSQRVLII